MFIYHSDIRCSNTAAEHYHGHVGQPLQKREDSLKVITNSSVGHTIVVHDLNATELVVGCVHFSAQHLWQEEEEEDLTPGKKDDKNYIC